MALRIFLGAFGQPGHAFPMLALGAELAARGHAVTFETWARWREHAEGAGMAFVAAPEYPVFPTRERPLGPYEATLRATIDTRPALVAARPDGSEIEFVTIVRVDTPEERAYYRHGGILPYVLRQLIAKPGQ